MKIDYECKICKTPSSVECQDDTPEHWIKVLAPILTCDRCYDRRNRFQTATETIINTCWMLRRAREYAPEKADGLTPKVRSMLMSATLAYAKVMADFRNLDAYVWDADFVRQLMDAPEHAAITLKKYRAMLKTHFQTRQIHEAFAHPSGHCNATAPDP
jgi:hypothetical protein